MGRAETLTVLLLLCFAHIPKTAGWTTTIILRKSFGARHVDVRPFFQKDKDFGLGDLDILQRLNKGLCSIAGHCVRPIIEYERLRNDVKYFTFLREPVSRYISQYRFRWAQGLHRAELEEWIKNPKFHNRMSRFLAGKPDADAAYRILCDRMMFVGLQENFDESLLMLRRKVGEGGGILDIHYGSAANVTSSTSVTSASELVTNELRPLLAQANLVDTELYNRVVEELYPRQLAEYGSTLAEDLDSFQRQNQKTPSKGKHLCSISNFASKMFYNKPLNSASRLLRRRSPNQGQYEWVTTERDGQSSRTVAG